MEVSNSSLLKQLYNIVSFKMYALSLPAYGSRTLEPGFEDCVHSFNLSNIRESRNKHEKTFAIKQEQCSLSRIKTDRRKLQHRILHCGVHVALLRTVWNLSQVDQETRTMCNRNLQVCAPFGLHNSPGKDFPEGVTWRYKTTCSCWLVQWVFSSAYSELKPAHNPSLCNTSHNARGMKKMWLLLWRSLLKIFFLIAK